MLDSRSTSPALLSDQYPVRPSDLARSRSWRTVSASTGGGAAGAGLDAGAGVDRAAVEAFLVLERTGFAGTSFTSFGAVDAFALLAAAFGFAEEGFGLAADEAFGLEVVAFDRADADAPLAEEDFGFADDALAFAAEDADFAATPADPASMAFAFPLDGDETDFTADAAFPCTDRADAASASVAAFDFFAIFAVAAFDALATFSVASLDVSATLSVASLEVSATFSVAAFDVSATLSVAAFDAFATVPRASFAAASARF